MKFTDAEHTLKFIEAHKQAKLETNMSKTY